MRQGSIRAFVCMAFLLLLGLGAKGQEYQRPKPTADGGPPTAADLGTYDGVSKTLTVQMLNLTPYDIQFVHAPGVTWSITSGDEAEMQDNAQNRFTPKSFMFVPVGIPSLIPAAPAQDFLDPGDPGYDPDYADTTTHPYTVVFSWNDHAGYLTDNWVKWTAKGVKYLSCSNSTPPVCVYRYQDVHLGLWMYRIKPTATFISDYLPTLISSLKVVFAALGIVMLPSPVTVINEFLCIVDLARADFAARNTQLNDGNKMWVASYVVPNPTSNCVRTNSGCTPSTMTPEQTGDAVYSQWTGTYAGPCTQTAGQWNCPYNAAEAMLVVSVHLLRGKAADLCSPFMYPNHCPLGQESVVMITVMRAEDFALGTLAGATRNVSLGDRTPTDNVRLFLLQAGAGRIRELLEKQGRPGLLELRSLIDHLDPAQQQVLREMIRSMGSGRLPTQQERQLLHSLADALQERLKRCCSPAAGAGSQCDERRNKLCLPHKKIY